MNQAIEGISRNLAAFSKGRSSSFQLNGLLRRSLFWQIGCGLAPALLWIGTKCNPADHPSRDKAIPRPKPLPRWAEYFWRTKDWDVSSPTAVQSPTATTPRPSSVTRKSKTTYAREYFAGTGHLSAALEKLGMQVEKFEA